MHFNTLLEDIVKDKEESKKEKVFVICGESCAGKDTLLNLIKDKYGFNTLISYTTRPPRINEVDGKDYYFVKKSKFINMIQNNEFIEYKRYVAQKTDTKKEIWFYGTSKKEFESKSKKISILDTSGIYKLQQYYGLNNLVIIYVDCPEDLREERAKNRKDFNEDKWEKRKQFDESIFTKKFFEGYVNHIIINNNDKNYLVEQADKLMKAYNIKPIE